MAEVIAALLGYRTNIVDFNKFFTINNFLTIYTWQIIVLFDDSNVINYCTSFLR